MNETILQLGYQLLEQLGITHMQVHKKGLRIVKMFDNQKIIAFGDTQDEVVYNFYYLYQELVNCN